MLSKHKKILSKLENKWGFEYDYSESNIQTMKSKIIITHKKCNTKFEQSPECHLKAKIPCSTCSKEDNINRCKSKTKTQEQFLIEAHAKHDDNYNYSEAVYINSLHKIILIHKKCQYKFEQSPTHHLNGHGCPKCGGMLKVTGEEILDRFHNKWGNAFEYPDNINGLQDKISIKHITCGNVFDTTPECHLNSKYSCPPCSIKERSETRTYKQEKFINKSNEIHNNEFHLMNLFIMVLIQEIT